MAMSHKTSGKTPVQKPFTWTIHEQGTPRESGVLTSQYGRCWFKYDMDCMRPGQPGTPMALYPDGLLHGQETADIGSAEWRRQCETTYMQNIYPREKAYADALSRGICMPCFYQKGINPTAFDQAFKQDLERSEWVGIRSDLVMKKTDFLDIHRKLESQNAWSAEMTATNFIPVDYSDVRQMIDRGIRTYRSGGMSCAFKFGNNTYQVPMDKMFIVDRTGTVAYTPVSMMNRNELEGSSVGEQPSQPDFM